MAKGVPITQEKIKARKRRRRMWIMLGALACISLFAAGLSFVSSLDIFQVKNIEISGNAAPDAAALQAIVERSLAGESFWIFPRSDIFFVSSKMMAADIADAFPSIASVSVSKKFFSTVVVTIEEKKSSAIWCLDSACDYIDSSGTAFEKAPVSATSSAIVFGDGSVPHIGMPLLPSDEFTPLMIFINDLPDRGIQPSSVALSDDGEANVYVGTSTYLIVDPTKDLSQSLANLDRVLSDATSGISVATLYTLQYIDLRFPDKIFYK